MDPAVSYKSPTQTQPTIPPPAPPPGLFNLGNTCYLNSVLQVLYHIPAFRSAILDWPGLPPEAQREPLTFASDLVETLRTVFHALDRAQISADKANTARHELSPTLLAHDPSSSADKTIPTTGYQNSQLVTSDMPVPSEDFRNYEVANHLDSTCVQDNEDVERGSAQSSVVVQQNSVVTNVSNLRQSSRLQYQQSQASVMFKKLEFCEDDDDDDEWCQSGDEDGEEDEAEEDDEDEDDEEEAIDPNELSGHDQTEFSEPVSQDVKDDVFNVKFQEDAERDSNMMLSTQTHGNIEPRSDMDGELREGLDYVEPHDIIALLRDEQRCIEFDARGQQDAHEFLRFLLDKVNDCMDASIKYERSATFQENGRSFQRSSTGANLECSEYQRSLDHCRMPGLVLDHSSNLKNFQLNSSGSVSKLGSISRVDFESNELDSKSLCSSEKADRRDTIADSSEQKASPRSPPTKRRRCELVDNDSIRGTVSKDVVRSLFGGRAVTTTRCQECEAKTERWEEFLDISLPVKAEKSLSWALSSHGQAEQLTGDNKYKCDVCHTYCEAKRWLKLASLPKVLTVHLKLFAFDAPLSGGGAKVSVAMPCPLRLRLKDWCSNSCAEQDDEYRLTAVIVHEGTGASSGHYYSFIYKEDGEGWYCCDDSVVSSISEEDMTQMLFTSMKTRRTAYVLFYTHYGSSSDR